MPEEYKVELSKPARDGSANLDKGDQRQVYKQLVKLKRAPELGTPLGNKMGFDLTGCRKLSVDQKRIRIIYEVAGRLLS